MATRAELFRYWSERSGPKRPKLERSRRDAPGEGTATRVSPRAAYLLERTGGRPSRKSTRKAANRQRTDVQMQVKRRVSAVRPSAP